MEIWPSCGSQVERTECPPSFVTLGGVWRCGEREQAMRLDLEARNSSDQTILAYHDMFGDNEFLCVRFTHHWLCDWMQNC